MIVAGIGCRKGADAAAIEAAITAALEHAGVAKIDLVATAMAKREEKGIVEAASARGVPLVLVHQADLEVASARGATWSGRVLALAGVPSVAEAAALAACGPESKLILPRIVVGPVTIALASAGETP